MLMREVIRRINRIEDVLGLDPPAPRKKPYQRIGQFHHPTEDEFCLTAGPTPAPADKPELKVSFWRRLFSR